jgi:hypothetical protein
MSVCLIIFPMQSVLYQRKADIYVFPQYLLLLHMISFFFFFFRNLFYFESVSELC